jgi:hypothetical protein
MTFTFDPNEHAKPKKDGYKYESTTPSIDTLADDIYQYMGGKGVFPAIDENAAEELTKIMAPIVVERLKERRNEIQNYNNDGEFKLRMSNYGQPHRKLWFEANVGTDLGATDPRAFLNFLIGDMWEAILLYIAKQTGHDVSMEQEEVELEGMIGHMDAVIDGYLVDVKSASKFSFERKFMSGALFEGDDPFAYIPQIKAYGEATGMAKQAWLVANKESGELGVVKVPDHIEYDAKAKLAEAREVIKLPEPPAEKCFEPIPHGKGGNMQLNGNCRFCPFKELCWKDDGLRAFQYASGPVYLTHVESEPRVDEIDIYGEWEDVHDEDQY